jgi:GABA(A) receptor-associated protein
MGAAASVGGAMGMLMSGPVSGAVLGAAAAYAATREDGVGTATRKVGTAYLHVADRAVDVGLRGADHALGEGRRLLSEVDSAKVPALLRPTVRALAKGHTEATGLADAQEAQRMRQRYPDRVPVICERSIYSELPEIKKHKFVVPGEMLCGEFKYIVHKQIAEAMGGSLKMEQTIYIFVNGDAPKTSTRMWELYERLKSADGFLHVRYAAENTLG